MKKKIEKFKQRNKDYLTFYHEILIPKHKYFSGEQNKEEKKEIIVISSPSRMGNHAILSTLDNHPDLPRIPGEDGFLYFTFKKANYDIHSFLNNLKSPKCLNFVMKLSGGKKNKWHEFKKAYRSLKYPKKYSGVAVKKGPATMDFQKTLFNINYKEYRKRLSSKISQINQLKSMKELFLIYLNAIEGLDFKPNNSRFSGYIMFSGMRRQILWLCKYFKKVKIIASLRHFASYAPSHISSRYKKRK